MQRKLQQNRVFIQQFNVLIKVNFITDYMHRLIHTYMHMFLDLYNN